MPLQGMQNPMETVIANVTAHRYMP